MFLTPGGLPSYFSGFLSLTGGLLCLGVCWGFCNLEGFRPAFILVFLGVFRFRAIFNPWFANISSVVFSSSVLAPVF